MKKITTIMLFVCICMSILCVNVFAEAEGDCGKNLEWYYADGCLSIYGTGNMFSYTSEGQVPWDDYREEITSVTIDYGVKSICNYAFENCENLRAIELTENITSIGANAFKNCTSLDEITIPAAVKKISNNTFYGCTKLVDVTIPESVTAIGDSAFEKCENLRRIDMSESSVKTIGAFAFYDCVNLNEVILSSCLTSIGIYTFSKCTAIDHIVLPPDITKIDMKAFAFCTGLSSLVVPESLEEISESMFGGCRSLSIINLPLSVSKVSKNAFENCVSLHKVYYNGDENDWTSINVETGNKCLTNAEIYCEEESAYIECPTCEKTIIADKHEYYAYNYECEECGYTPELHNMYYFVYCESCGEKIEVTEEEYFNNLYECDVCGYIHLQEEQYYVECSECSNTYTVSEDDYLNGDYECNICGYNPNAVEGYFVECPICGKSFEVGEKVYFFDNYRCNECGWTPEGNTTQGYNNGYVQIKLTIGQNFIYINGEILAVDAAPIIRNDRTMVPIRVIAEALGANVSWENKNDKGTVVIESEGGGHTYHITIGEKNVVVQSNPWAEDFDPLKNTNPVLDSPAFIENDRTYLPVRFVSESLGAKVEWDSATLTVIITK